MDDPLYLKAHAILNGRTWPDLDTNATIRACYDASVACIVDFLKEGGETPFRRGIRAAVQAAVDDLAGLIKRRKQAMANEAHTAVIAGIARRLAVLPMPGSEGDVPPPMLREILTLKVARTLAPTLDWDQIEDITIMPPEFVEAWRAADEIVVLVRYA